MKKLVIICLVIFSSISLAASSAIFSMLDTSDTPAPRKVLNQIEQRYADQAIIVEFELEIEQGKATYEVTLYQTAQQRFIELLLDHNGQVITLEYKNPELDEQEEVAAAAIMKRKKLSMQQLVQQLDNNPQHYLIEAQLEQDMGISYMVATFVTAEGKHKKAIDLETGKHLPLLRWGN